MCTKCNVSSRLLSSPYPLLTFKCYVTLLNKLSHPSKLNSIHKHKLIINSYIYSSCLSISGITVFKVCIEVTITSGWIICERFIQLASQFIIGRGTCVVEEVEAGGGGRQRWWRSIN